MSTPIIFVYGTLRLEYANEAAKRIQTECTYLGQGVAKGALMDLGPYPGAIINNTYLTIIYGQCFLLPQNPDPLLAFLDDYEGPEYRREIHDIYSWRGITPAIIYHLDAYPNAQPVPEGDWYTYQSQRDSKKLS